MTAPLIVAPGVRERAELTLSRLDGLPPLPQSAAQLLGAASSKRTSARDLVRIIELDAALTAAILRLLRRADLGVSNQVISVERAVPLLGLERVRQAALAAQFLSVFEEAGRDPQIDEHSRQLWKHNLASATAAELLAGQIPRGPDAAAAFVCGLLHDIGKLALLYLFPKAYGRAIRQAENDNICICDAERNFFGMDHTFVGKTLAAKWQLPRSIVDCAWLHHLQPTALPTSLADSKMLGLVHVADVMVRRLRIGFSGYLPIGALPEAAEGLGLTKESLAAVEEKLPRALSPLFELIGDETANGPAFYAESLSRANRELGRINNELLQRNAELGIKAVSVATLLALQETTSQPAPVAEICAAAAVALQRMMNATETAVGVVPIGTDLCHVGRVGQSDRAPRTTILAPTDGGLSESVGDQLAGGPKGFSPLSSTLETFWQKAAGASTGEARWILPVQHPRVRYGAAILSCDQAAVARWTGYPTELAVISNAVAQAIATAVERQEAERLSQDLLDSHRRVQAAESDRLRQRSVAMIAEMAAGAAHELHNPLAVISGRAQMELPRAEDPALSRALEVIVEQTMRASQIVMDLMSFAKPVPPNRVVLSLQEVLPSIAQQWRAKSGVSAEQISISLHDNTATVAADAAQLRDILDSLLANAVEACSRETARIEINSHASSSDETVRIVVADNGAGMSRYVLDHALDPFFSSRPAGRGRGLGLSRAYRLTEINGGRLWIESDENRGTRVTVELPAGVGH